MKDFILILNNIRSLHNVGSIFRTADGVGVKKIYLTGITPGPLDRLKNSIPQFAKVSLGAEKNIDWEKTFSCSRLIEKLKKENYIICALEQGPTAVSYNDFPKKLLKNKKGVVLIVGNEVRGIPPGILKKADIILEIPMRGKKESLNVSVALGIAAYRLAEVLRD